MKTLYRAALIVAAFVLFLPLSAHAEIKAGSVEFGIFGGYNFFEERQNLDDSPVIGARLGYNFTPHFGVEGVAEFINTNVDDMDKRGDEEGQYRGPMDNVHLTFYHVDAVYHIVPEGKFNPFVVLGFGGAHYSPKISDKDMAAFNAGIGAKLWINEHLALRMDIRDYNVSEVFNWNYNNIAATIGLTVAFGGPSKAAPVEKVQAKPAPAPVAEVKPVEKPVVVLVTEPKVEEKVKVLATEPKIEELVIVLALEDVNFDFDKSTLTPEAQAILKRNILILKKNPKAKIRIAGYTSASGTPQYNQKLSERRAAAVMDYLVAEGVATPERLSEVGYGEANPQTFEAAPKDIYSNAAKSNMRVLFEIIVK